MLANGSDCKTSVPSYCQTWSQIQRAHFSVSVIGFTSTPVSDLYSQFPTASVPVFFFPRDVLVRGELFLFFSYIHAMK